MKPPPAYYDLVALWGLSRYQKRVLWGALCRSKWSVPVDWRARLSAGQERDRDILCAPAVILYVLEALKGGTAALAGRCGPDGRARAGRHG